MINRISFECESKNSRLFLEVADVDDFVAEPAVMFILSPHWPGPMAKLLD
jgi:hypothetical protein